ncbi:unnamed protein product [Closterium sp. NIES-53]
MLCTGIQSFQEDGNTSQHGAQPCLGARQCSATLGGVGSGTGAGAGDSPEPGAARAGGTGAGGTSAGGAGAGGAGAVGARAGGTGVGGARSGGAGAVAPGAGGARARGAVSGGTGAGGTKRPRLYFVSLLQQVLGVPSSTGLTPPLLCPPPDQSQPLSYPASPLPAPSPYPNQTCLTERREPASRPGSPVCTGHRVPHPRPPPVPGTHAMALRPSSVPLPPPLPPPPESSLPAIPDPESDLARAASPTVSHLLATVITGPSFESTAASALVAELSASPPSVGGECALGTDVLEDKQKDFDCLAAAVPRFASMLLGPEGDPYAPDIPTPSSYAEAITGQPARGDLAVLPTWLHWVVSQWSLRWPLYGLRQAPREWHDTLRTTLATQGFTPSTADPLLFLPTDTSLTLFYVLVYIDDLVFATADTEALTLMKSELQKRHSCTDLGPSALRLPVLLATAYSSAYQPLALSSTFRRVLMYLMTCTRPDLTYPLSLQARYVAPNRHRKVHWDAAKRVLRYLCSTSSMGLVLGGRGPVVFTGHADASWVDDSAKQRSSQGYTFSLGAMATQELRWLTYVPTDLQCGQLRLAYVATRANTADIFTKALPPGDHQRFSTVLGLVPTLPHLLTT